MIDVALIFFELLLDGRVSYQLQRFFVQLNHHLLWLWLVSSSVDHTSVSYCHTGVCISHCYPGSEFFGWRYKAPTTLAQYEAQCTWEECYWRKKIRWWAMGLMRHLLLLLCAHVCASLISKGQEELPCFLKRCWLISVYGRTQPTSENHLCQGLPDSFIVGGS